MNEVTRRTGVAWLASRLVLELRTMTGWQIQYVLAEKFEAAASGRRFLPTVGLLESSTIT